MGTRYTMGPVSERPATADPNQETLCVQFPSGQRGYFIYRMSIFGPAETIARVYLGFQISRANFRAVSYFGKMDDADFPAGLYVPPGLGVIVAWYDVASPADLNHPVPLDHGTITASFEFEYETYTGGAGATTFSDGG